MPQTPQIAKSGDAFVSDVGSAQVEHLQARHRRHELDPQIGDSGPIQVEVAEFVQVFQFGQAGVCDLSNGQVRSR